jgi:hypothetical protein
MATPLPTQRPVARPSASAKSGSSLNIALLVLLLASIGAGGYGWVNLNGRIVALEKKPTPAATARPTTAAGIQPVGPAATTGFNNYAGGPGGQGGRGGRGGRGGGAANTATRLGLDLSDAQLNQLDSLANARMQAMRDDPNADTSALDNQIADIVGIENVNSFTGFGGGGRGGRGGRGGGGAGGPGGGFGGGG